MAQELEDGEFWLPSDFLTDDEPLTDYKTDRLKTKGINDFPQGFGGSFGFNLDLSSPVESVIGSTETESDEDDFISGLTRKIAPTIFQDSNIFSDYKPKERKLSTSPQSTLCACKQGLDPNYVTRVSSPTEVKDVGWDLLYTAAEELARMRMIDETTPFHSNKLFAPPPKPNHNALPAKRPTPATGFYPTQAQPHADVAYLRMQAAQQMMNRDIWGQGKIEHQFQNRKMTGETGGRTQGLSMAAWPTLQQSQFQQKPGSGMRAVFLGETGVKKERTGTGVFLPRCFETNSSETRKRTGYSTVLIPERVVHALNLNIDSIEAQSLYNSKRSFIPDNVMMAQRQPVMNKELGFFQDWTY